MYQYFVSNQVAAVTFIVIVLAIILFFVVKKLQSIGLNKIRARVYHLFVEAENTFNHGDNTQKFEYVINWAEHHIPAPFNLFITESLLRKVVQMWFDLVKDLLDDGRINGSGEE